MIARRQFLFGCASSAAIVLPLTRKLEFPRPKFSIGEEVVAPWESEDGMQYSHAVIIGMMHDPYDYEPTGWWYLPAWIDNPRCPWMVGRDDGHFWHESYLRSV